MQKLVLSGKEHSDVRMLIKLIGIYCRQTHKGPKTSFHFRPLNMGKLQGREVALCEECTRLLSYGLTMRLKCPHDPKPICKKCETQCYRGDYKERIREVMKFSGMYLVKHGRLDLLYHYLR